MKIRKRPLGEKKGLSKRKKGTDNVMDKVWIKIHCIRVWSCRAGNKTKRTSQQKLKVIFRRQETNYVDWDIIFRNDSMYTYMTWTSTQYNQGLDIPIGDKQVVSGSKKRLNTEFSVGYIHSVNVLFKYKQAYSGFRLGHNKEFRGFKTNILPAIWKMRWIMSVKQETFTLIQVKNADNFTKNQE